jgi:hypothetical protein
MGVDGSSESSSRLLPFGFGEQEDGGDEAENADDGCCAFGSGQSVPVHEEGEGEDAEEPPILPRL